MFSNVLLLFLLLRVNKKQLAKVKMFKYLLPKVTFVVQMIFFEQY